MPNALNFFLQILYFRYEQINEQFSRDTAFLSQAVTINNKLNAFPQNVNLLPMDLSRLVLENWKEKGCKQPAFERVPIPDKKHLAQQITELNERLSCELQKLSDLKKNASGFEVDHLDETSKSCIRSRYNLVLNSLMQILTDFSYCFANDMEVWCRQQDLFENDNAGQEKFDNFGPRIKQAGKLIKNLHLLIEDMRNLACLPADLKNSCHFDAIDAKMKTLETIKLNFEYSKVLRQELEF